MAGFWKRVGGALGRLVGRGEGEQPPPAPQAPQAPSGGEPSGPSAPPEPPPSFGGPGGGEPPEDGGGEEEEREYPDSASVSIAGHWVVSSSRWNGVISGSLDGAAAQEFHRAMEQGDEATAVQLVADAYDDQNMGFASGLDVGSSSWASIDY